MKDISSKTIFVFLAGLIIGAAVVWFVICPCWKKQCGSSLSGERPGPKVAEPVMIDAGIANTYFNTYMLSPESVVPFKGFAVNLAQYDAMTKILYADTTVQGFRIYMGATDTTSSGRIFMVVGFGTPDHYASIYATDSEESGPCPFVCDETSPIIQPPK